jgi:hypothetical protein
MSRILVWLVSAVAGTALIACGDTLGQEDETLPRARIADAALSDPPASSGQPAPSPTYTSGQPTDFLTDGFAQDQQDRGVNDPEEPLLFHADYAETASTASDLVVNSDAVIVGTVTGERRGPWDGPPELPEAKRLLSVDVDTHSRGRAQETGSHSRHQAGPT